MIIDAYKTTNELEELRHTYHNCLRQLDIVRASLHNEISKLMATGVDEDFYRVAEITYSSFQDMETAMQKLEKALAGICVLIQNYQAYMTAEKEFTELLGDKQ